MKKTERITKDMTLAEVAQKCPETALVFLKHGFSCLGCPAVPNETIEEAARVHDLDLNNLLEELNQGCQKKSK